MDRKVNQFSFQNNISVNLVHTDLPNCVGLFSLRGMIEHRIVFLSTALVLAP